MMKIKFMYYDKSVCRRCKTSDRNVSKAVRDLKSVMRGAGEKVVFRQTRLPLSKIHLSPSITINGRDIESIVSGKKKLKSNSCKDCCRKAGRPVECRKFTYRGKSYDYIPKALIKEAMGRMADR